MQATEFHPFKPGGLIQLDRRGARNATCRECGLMQRARRHWDPERSLAAREKQSATRRARGLNGRGARASRARLPAPELAIVPAPAAAPVPTPPPRVADWRLSMLRLALDMALEGPSLSFPLRRALLDARGALRSELHGIPATAGAVLELPEPDPVPETHSAALPNGHEPPRAMRPIQSARVQRTARGFRGDNFRALYLRAVECGWQWEHRRGSGHVALYPPDGRKPVVLSITAPSSEARGWMNARADAKRAGLDVTGL